jgi:hypothetical protein
VLCADPRFRDWVAEGRSECEAEDAASYVRHHCGVLSRTELDKHETAGKRWDDIVSRYRIATGQQAEPR